MWEQPNFENFGTRMKDIRPVYLKNTMDYLHYNAYIFLDEQSTGYYSHCWSRSNTTNHADVEVSFIKYKRHNH